jgi:hypothetical protein
MNEVEFWQHPETKEIIIICAWYYDDGRPNVWRGGGITTRYGVSSVYVSTGEHGDLAGYVRMELAPKGGQ